MKLKIPIIFIVLMSMFILSSFSVSAAIVRCGEDGFPACDVCGGLCGPKEYCDEDLRDCITLVGSGGDCSGGERCVYPYDCINDKCIDSASDPECNAGYENCRDDPVQCACLGDTRCVSTSCENCYPDYDAAAAGETCGWSGTITFCDGSSSYVSGLSCTGGETCDLTFDPDNFGEKGLECVACTRDDDPKCSNGNLLTCENNNWVTDNCAADALNNDCIDSSTCAVVSGSAQCVEVYADLGTTCTIGTEVKACNGGGACDRTCVPYCPDSRECGASLNTCDLGPNACGSCVTGEICSDGICATDSSGTICMSDADCEDNFYCYILDDGSVDKGELLPFREDGVCEPNPTSSAGACPGGNIYYVGKHEIYPFLATSVGFIPGTIDGVCTGGGGTDCSYCLDSDSFRKETFNGPEVEYNNNLFCSGGSFSGVCLSTSGHVRNDETSTTNPDKCISGSDSIVRKYFIDGISANPDQTMWVDIECPNRLKCVGGACLTACITESDCVGAAVCRDGKCEDGSCNPATEYVAGPNGECCDIGSEWRCAGGECACEPNEPCFLPNSCPYRPMTASWWTHSNCIFKTTDPQACCGPFDLFGYVNDPDNWYTYTDIVVY